MKYSRLRGMQDIISPDIYKWQGVERIFRETFERFGYQGIRTPVMEPTDLFKRAVGEDTDIIMKEMYTFTDRGGRSVTLRPENTASVVRAYLESGMHRLGGIVRLYYSGPMFRYERPQAGRYRQFHQVGVEAIGSINPAVDVEVMEVVLTALEAMGFTELSVKVNSVGCPVCRVEYRRKLKAALSSMLDGLCSDCRERMERNPMRVFDCKKCEAVKESLPAISSQLCGECRDHFDGVLADMKALGWEFEVDPRLVRGLDYYTKTTFEIVHSELGAQNAICGGGRYDDLVEECGGPPTPAVGFSVGLERVLSVLPPGSPAGDASTGLPDFYLVCADEESSLRTLRAARALREVGRVVADFSLRAVKKQLRSAEKSGAAVAVIVESASPQSLHWKEMAAREQVDVEDAKLLDYAAEKLKKGKRN